MNRHHLLCTYQKAAFITMLATSKTASSPAVTPSIMLSLHLPQIEVNLQKYNYQSDKSISGVFLTVAALCIQVRCEENRNLISDWMVFDTRYPGPKP